MENEKTKLGPKPSEEIAVWGLGLLVSKTDLMLERLDKLNELTDKRVAFLLSHIDRKMDVIIELLRESKKSLNN